MTTPRMVSENKRAEYLSKWEEMGRPEIVLNPGAVIQDLTKFLSGRVSPAHEKIIREFLEV